MTTIWHLTDPGTWAEAQRRGALDESTRGATVADVGFVHASYAGQVPAVAGVVYADVTGPMVALAIDADLLPEHGLELRDEPGDPGSPTLFPHVYGGDVPLAVITGAVEVRLTAGAITPWPPAP